MEKALERIVLQYADKDELRLAYNIMQFFPITLKRVDTKLCTNAFEQLEHKLNQPFYQSTQKVGYILKCMLFLLHRRRYDENFLKYDEQWMPEGKLGLPLRAYTPAQKTHEKTRKALIDYLRGCGTIEGIPLGDD